MNEPNTGKTIRLHPPITASGYHIAGFAHDNITWYDCRELLPVRDSNQETDITSVWCLVLALDGTRYMGYYNFTWGAWFESVPIWRSVDIEDDNVYQFYKIAQPYKWCYFPIVPELPIIQEDQ